MPIGPDFNLVSSAGALNRPVVVKKPGVSIKPIQFEEVNPHEKTDQPKKGQAVRSKKGSAPGVKSVRKAQREKRS